MERVARTAEHESVHLLFWALQHHPSLATAMSTLGAFLIASATATFVGIFVVMLATRAGDMLPLPVESAVTALFAGRVVMHMARSVDHAHHWPTMCLAVGLLAAGAVYIRQLDRLLYDCPSLSAEIVAEARRYLGGGADPATVLFSTVQSVWNADRQTFLVTESISAGPGTVCPDVVFEHTSSATFFRVMCAAHVWTAELGYGLLLVFQLIRSPTYMHLRQKYWGALRKRLEKIETAEKTEKSD